MKKGAIREGLRLGIGSLQRWICLLLLAMCLSPGMVHAASSSSNQGPYDQLLLFYGKTLSIIPPGVFIALIVANLIIHFGGLVIAAKVCFGGSYIIAKSLKCWVYTFVAFICYLLVGGLIYLLGTVFGGPAGVIILAVLDVLVFAAAVLIFIPMNVFEGTFVRTILFAVLNALAVWPLCALASSVIGKAMISEHQGLAFVHLTNDLSKGKIKENRDYLKEAESRQVLEEQDAREGVVKSASELAQVAENNETPQMRLAQEKAGLEARAEMLARQKAELKEGNKLGLRLHEQDYALYQKAVADFNAKVKAMQPAAPSPSEAPR